MQLCFFDLIPRAFAALLFAIVKELDICNRKRLDIVVANFSELKKPASPSPRQCPQRRRNRHPG